MNCLVESQGECPRGGWLYSIFTSEQPQALHVVVLHSEDIGIIQKTVLQVFIHYLLAAPPRQKLCKLQTAHHKMNFHLSSQNVVVLPLPLITVCWLLGTTATNSVPAPHGSLLSSAR